MFSRLLPSGAGEPSIYETLRESEELSGPSDIEERAGMALDEDNLGGGFQDHELEEALINEIDSPTTLSREESSSRIDSRPATSNHATATRSKRSLRKPLLEDFNDDVPQSLLFEGDEDEVAEAGKGRTSEAEINAPVPGPATPDTLAKWQTVRGQQRLHPVQESRLPEPRYIPRRPRSSAMVHPREQAMWRWANVENLDNFLKDVYDYFLGNGIKCILLGRVLNLL